MNTADRPDHESGLPRCPTSATADISNTLSWLKIRMRKQSLAQRF